jgi:hypothetical protein
VTAEHPAELAIEGLQRAYADISTREAWDEFAALVTPDCKFLFDTSSGGVFELNGPEQFVEFAKKTAVQFDLWVYDPVNFVVTVDPAGTATGRTYSFEIEQDRESGEVISSYGRYEDEYVLLDGRWRWSSRRYRNVARRNGDEPWRRNH